MCKENHRSSIGIAEQWARSRYSLKKKKKEMIKKIACSIAFKFNPLIINFPNICNSSTVELLKFICITFASFFFFSRGQYVGFSRLENGWEQLASVRNETFFSRPSPVNNIE